MIERQLGRTGISTLPLGFGGIPIQRLSLAESDLLLQTALDAGISFFDSAQAYTDSEQKMGRILSAQRKRVAIASKSLLRSGREIGLELQLSLAALKTDYLDIYQLHNVASAQDLQAVLAPDGALEELEKALQAGKIRFVGISGHKPALLREALRQYPFATVQVPVNFMETLALPELLPQAKEAGVGIIAMKPMAGGALQERALNLRFILAQGVEVAIPGVDAPAQIRENLACLQEIRPLDEFELARLEKEKEELGQTFCRRCEYCLPCPVGLPIAFLHVLRGYFFRYNLHDWVWERLRALPKSFPDCLECGECRNKCPYDLDTPAIFREAWQAIRTRD